jgi:hypothetical protein
MSFLKSPDYISLSFLPLRLGDFLVLRKTVCIVLADGSGGLSSEQAPEPHKADEPGTGWLEGPRLLSPEARERRYETKTV